jgi:hypothetical protein
MNRTIFLVIVAVISIVYGLGFLFAPHQFGDMHHIAGSPGFDLMSRLHAAYLIGFGIIAWLARNAADSDGLTAIMRGGLAITVLTFIVALIATWSGQINALGWVSVILSGLIGAGFAYYGFRPRSAV